MQLAASVISLVQCPFTDRLTWV